MGDRACSRRTRAFERKRFRRDDAAQVSFAVIAVALLTATAITGAYIAKAEFDKAKAEKRGKLLRAMEQTIDEVAQELSLCGASRAQDVVSGWDEYPVNETRISEAFSESMSEYLRSAFPRSEGEFEVGVVNWTGGLFYLERKTVDLVPSENASSEGLSVDGAEMEYQQLPAPSEEQLGEVTTTPYYIAVGNFSVEVSAKSFSLSRLTSFQRPVISALPFLESKLRAFEQASEGELSDLGRLVGYMLSTLCELRVLEGYGQPMYSGKNTSEILTEEDVYRAVAVGLLLEQARLFRDVDLGFASKVARACGGGYPGTSAFLSPRARALDPAELFLWYLGKTQLNIDPKMLVAQTFFGIADQFVIKIMDYMGWMGALEAAKSALDALTGGIDSLISYLTGADKAHVAVTSWITRTLDATGASPSVCSELFSANGDFTVAVPQKRYFVQDAASNLYPVWVGNITAVVDVPEYDLLRSAVWRDFYSTYKDLQSSFRQLLEDGLKRFAFDIASISDVRLGGATIDPSDGTDLFTALATRSGEVDLVLDPAALAQAARGLPMFSAQYELAEEFSQFVDSRGQELFDREPMLEGVYSDLACSVLSSARYAYIPDLVVPVEEQLAAIVRNDVQYDAGWGVGDAATSVFDGMCSVNLHRLEFIVDQSVVKVDDGFAGPMVDSLAGLVVQGAKEFPSIEKAIEDLLGAFSKQVLSQKRMSAYKQAVLVDLERPFEFWEGDREAAEGSGRLLTESVSVDVLGDLPPLQVVQYDERLGYASLEQLFPTDNMLVQIKRPWDYDRSEGEYPNIHMTSLGDWTAAPYTTQWTASVLGLLELSLCSNNSALQSLLSDLGVSSSRSVKISFELPVTVHSSWPLQGVEYNPSNTFIGDAIAAAKKFCEIIWDKLEPVVGWVKDGFERIFKFVERAFEVFASFAIRILKMVASALQTLVETLQEYVQKIANSALAKVVDVFVDLTGRVEFRISLYGFLIIVQTRVPDLIYRHGNDLLRIIVSTDRFGPSIAFGVRIARLTDGSFDILANGTIRLKSATIEVIVDPLMHIMRKFVEVHCTARTWRLDLSMPEVETYELAEVSTADLPGAGAFLSNIPIPALGLSASIEAGIRLKYSPPFPTDVVVNEFESNPRGEDSGREWVELYNPLDKPRCIDGWSIATVHGRTASIVIHGTIQPNGLLVFEFPETSIDNGNPDDPFNDGDAIVLMDPSGATVDITPIMRDTANDERTLQRIWDGGPKWELSQGSRGASNGLPVLLATSDFIAKALFEAFKEAFMQTQLQEVSASLDFVTLFAKRVLHNFIENLLALVKEIIHEITFFIQVLIGDASGSAGLGFRASFVVTGEAIVDLLRWLIHSFATFVVNLGRPSSPIAYPAFPSSIFSGLFLRFEVVFEVGLPRMIRLLGAVGDLEKKFMLAISIAPNIPALGKLVGKNWGDWKVEFGAYLEGVPKEFAMGYLTKDVGDLIDFWIVKGAVYGV